ncbi:PREDICTED: putative late blight resistance protein homolog R1B-17 isoform X2 [Ipomoea nil]|uniref:putative late blight resistance protein homolog R1B-17 isoform X2 n=1 Tax=Ipomoea nil TaxID=35883 RepID=UPI000900CA8D|nr:PREDICTED: putative late blight resistance protein homolog R1B-17 isoform X2 [Ipomoea nil]
MAFVALTSLMETIRLEFLQSDPRVPLDAEKLSDLQLSRFQDFLQKPPSGASAKTIKYLNTKIRDFALQAEDHIETQLHTLLLAKHHDAEKASLALHQALRKPTQKAAELLNIISTTISSEAAENTNIKTQPPSLLKQAAASGRSENVQSSEKGRSWWRSPEKICMIGRRHDCDVIKDRLLRGSSELGLIPIVGMVGIGKTTLVKTIYTDPALLSHFQVRGGVTMRPEFDKTQMLSDLLRSINGAESNETKEGITTTTSDLANQLRKCLNGKRYVIVLDNLLNHLAWDDIHRYFPNDGNGSCILLTTRHFDGYYARGSADHIHYMTLLDPKESWDLFYHILPHNKKSMISKFETIREALVEKCEGLAQSIVTVTKRLSECDNIEKEWKKIEKELESLGILDRNDLTLNYNQLPQHLNVCFLYFGTFPKRSEILVKTLFRLWIVEGFVMSENQAYKYLQELIDRSLVLIHSRSSNGQIKTCRMHGALHTFCVGEAQKGGIFCAVNTRQHLGLPLDVFANSCRWLSLYTHSFDYYVLFRTNNLRSIFFHENPEMFVDSKLIRVLAFVPSPSFVPSYPLTRKNFEDLVFLRYLSLTQWFENLEHIVSANPNLQTLIISKTRTSNNKRLSSEIWKSPQLRHVEVSYSLSVDPPSEVKHSLHTLYWLSLEHCTKEVFSRIPNVKKLGIICGCESNNPNGVDSDNLGNLDCLDKLETLMVAFRKGSSVSAGFQNLNSLSHCLNIKKLKLKRTCLAWRELNTISMLPNLESLKLKEASNDSDWEPTEGNFEKLKLLFLEARNLVRWEINRDEQFGCLERLVLKRCISLEAIPIDFADIITLESIELRNCSPSAMSSAQQINVIRNDDYGYKTVDIHRG